MRARIAISATVIALMLGLAIAQAPKLYQPVFAYHTPDSRDNIIKATKPADSKLYLSMTYSPQFITHDDKATTFEFRLFNVSTSQTITHITYLVTLTKNNDPGTKPSLVDLFHSHSGPLALKINVHNDSNDHSVVIHGERDPFYNAWVADNALNPLGIDASREALDAGRYHLRVEIFGIDNDRNVFNPEDMPTFDLTFSLPEVQGKQVPFQDRNYNVTLISYTDKITNFQFDKNTGQFVWSIPFNWDAEYLNSTHDDIFIHQEIKVPNSFPRMLNSSDSTESKKVNATVNGFPLNDRNFIADPYTFQDYTVFHYVLNKNDMIKMAGQLQNPSSNPAEATFTLASSVTVPEFSPAYVLAIAVAVIIVSINVAARKRT